MFEEAYVSVQLHVTLYLISELKYSLKFFFQTREPAYLFD